MISWDAVVVGGGAAGMMCAAVAGQRGRKVAIIDHASKRAEKIRISGGGRCNFTNRNTSFMHFFSANPAFSRSALAQYGADDFIQLLRSYRIPFHEKHKGQLFCDESSQDIIRMLEAECEKGDVRWYQPCTVNEVLREADGFSLMTTHGVLRAKRVVIATGGLAIPQIGATDWGVSLARSFGLAIVETRPALVPLTFEPDFWQPFSQLAGVALEVDVSCQVGKEKACFREDLLLTHRGMSGPAILQISTVWKHGAELSINWVPDHAMADVLIEAKSQSRAQIATILASYMPKRLAQEWDQVTALEPSGAFFRGWGAHKVADCSDKRLINCGKTLNEWSCIPKGSEGYKKAEVMRGGVDTRALNQKTMESKQISGLHFIGEVVDMTGWLGGYNFQWAWSSGVAAGKAI